MRQNLKNYYSDIQYILFQGLRCTPYAHIKHKLTVFSTFRLTVIITIIILGIKVDDKSALEKAQINPQEVARIVAEAFNEMIFKFG